MSLSDILFKSISVMSVVIALLAFLYTWLSNKPRFKGRLNYAIVSPLATGEDPQATRTTALCAYITLVNLGRNPVFVEDYKLEIDRGSGYESIHRLKRIRVFPEFSIGQDLIRLNNWREWLIYFPPKAVEYGIPLSGMVVFYILTPHASLMSSIRKYRLTVIDAFGKRHKFETTPDRFMDTDHLVEMFMIGGAEVAARDN